jgi:signal transduction histidine kinase
MKVRTYGLLLLGLAGIVPLALYGTVAIERSQTTSVQQVRESNRSMANLVARTISEHIQHQHELLATLGRLTLESAEPDVSFLGVQLDPAYQHLQDIVVYRVSGGRIRRVLGRPPSAREQSYDELALQVITSGSDDMPLDMHETQLSHLLQLTAPIWIGGSLQGVVVGRYDLVGIWQFMHSARVGKGGFARLISLRFGTLAHGNPDERGVAFIAGGDNSRELLERSGTTGLAENHRGEAIVVSSAPVDALRWRDPSHAWYVSVEQPVDEAFAPARAVREVLLLAGVVGLLMVALIGLVIGRTLVRSLERLRQHTEILPGALDTRLGYRSRLLEVQSLAESLDTMAGALVSERDQARKRERLTTFGRVAAGLVHDLRLPIEAVRGACAEIVKTPDDEYARALLRKVSERELSRLKRFVDDMERLARQGAIDTQLTEVAPEALAREVVEELAVHRKWTGVGFEVRGLAMPTFMDRDLMKRAILNLVGNGADACTAKGPGSSVVVEVADGARDTLEFRVIDSGVGMARDMLDTIESSDFRSTKRMTGVGLGLGVVRHIAETHAGELSVDSELGTGSTFTLRIPRRSVEHSPS